MIYNRLAAIKGIQIKTSGRLLPQSSLTGSRDRHWASDYFKYPAAALMLFLNSCSSFDLIPSDSLMQRVNGRGPVLVSSDNPYLAANLLLQQESKKSKELAGFLAQAGQPSAIKVQQKIMQPANMTLYYKTQMQQYNMELLRGVWVIDGPYPITDSSVSDMLKSQPATELLAETKISKPTPEIQENKIAEIVSTPAAKHQLTPKENFDLNTTENTNSEYEPIFDITQQQKEPTQDAEEIKNTQENESTEIQAQTRASAETTPRGDIVHYVSSEAESLELLAVWYTGNKSTLSRIAKANNITTDSQISLGDQIIIPAEFVKNKHIPTATDLAQIIIDRQESE